jgi:hypothetical protein
MLEQEQRRHAVSIVILDGYLRHVEDFFEKMAAEATIDGEVSREKKRNS